VTSTGNGVIYDVTDAANDAVAASFKPRRYTVISLLLSDVNARRRYLVDITCLIIFVCFMCLPEMMNKDECIYYQFSTAGDREITECAS